MRDLSDAWSGGERDFGKREEELGDRRVRGEHVRRLGIKTSPPRLPLYFFIMTFLIQNARLIIGAFQPACPHGSSDVDLNPKYLAAPQTHLSLSRSLTTTAGALGWRRHGRFPLLCFHGLVAASYFENTKSLSNDVTVNHGADEWAFSSQWGSNISVDIDCWYTIVFCFFPQLLSERSWAGTLSRRVAEIQDVDAQKCLKQSCGLEIHMSVNLLTETGWSIFILLFLSEYCTCVVVCTGAVGGSGETLWAGTQYGLTFFI